MRARLLRADPACRPAGAATAGAGAGIIAERTGQPLSRIEKDSDRDNFMSAGQAAEYG
nr:ATP-dependent Clp protease proteolytic subunit [Massilia sp. LC238]